MQIKVTSSGVVENAATIPCRLVIIRRGDREIFLIDEAGRYGLPIVTIPRQQRAAPHLQESVHRLWELDVICRFMPQCSYSLQEERYYVLEAVGSEPRAIGGTAWLPVSELREVKLVSEGSAEYLTATLEEARRYNEGDSRYAFAHSGWLDEVITWADHSLESRALRLTGNCSQYNMGPFFSLLRFETNGPHVWFKAVGEPNLREFSITTILAKLNSRYLPKLLSTRTDWHGWLMLDGNGQHLDANSGFDQWERTAWSLAALQIDSIEHCQELLDAGCTDLRIPRLRALIDPLLQTIHDLMRLQPMEPPCILTAADFGLIHDQLHTACDAMEASDIPDTLGSTDINGGNVLVGEENAVFLDWMEGYVGHPFFVCEYLVALLRRIRPDLQDRSKTIRDAYCRPWQSRIDAHSLATAARYIPLVAVLAFAVACPGREQKPTKMLPELAKLLRALARRIHAEALCL